MNQALQLGRFSFGMGDRFAHQAKAQLQACILAAKQGVEIIPVWNKSNREHTIIGSEPASVRAAAYKAIKELGWKKTWHIDADHIRLETVDRFLSSSDFFTLDVADSIGKPAPAADINAFVKRHPELAGEIEIPGITRPIKTTRADVERIAAKYLFAVQDAGKIYRHIAKAKGAGNFITEVSMDETDAPQTPPELLIILAAMADEKIPLQTIAPKFTGRFNKGVDYVGDVAQFEREFNEDLAVIAHAILRYGLPENLKLSVHSGSDKFSIYPAIRAAPEPTGWRNSSDWPRPAATPWRSPRRFIATRWIIAPSFAPPTPPSLTLTRRNCHRRKQFPNGLPRNTAPPSGTTRNARNTIPISGSFFTSASRLPPRRATATSRCWKPTKPSSDGT